MSGVELILAAVSFPLGVIAAVECFQKAGEFLANRVHAYKNPHPIVEDFLVFGIGLHQGLYPFDVEQMQWAYTENKSKQLQAVLERGLEKLKGQLIEADKLLSKVLNDDGSIRKTRFFYKDVERELNKCAEGLRKWQIIFAGTIDQIRSHHKEELKANLLDSSKFAELSTAQTAPAIDVIGGEISGGSYFRIVPAEIKSPDSVQPRPANVLIEPLDRPQLGNADDRKSTLSDLARRLSLQKSGLLRCLGYRAEPNMELVFEVPASISVQESLWQRLMRESAGVGTYAGGRTLGYRYELSRQIARAVMSTHTCGLVHKNIRSDTILLFQLTNSDTGTQAENLAATNERSVFTQWASSRVTTAVSIRESADEWKKDVYRHPSRQGIHIDERYNMGHDIYSFGVCLLEIGLWEPLIVKDKDSGAHQLSTCVMNEAIKGGHATEDDRARTDRCLEPDDVKSVLTSLAGNMLPSRMGSIYTDIVKSCLTCLEGGLGDVADFNDANVIGAKFNEVVIAALTDIRV